MPKIAVRDVPSAKDFFEQSLAGTGYGIRLSDDPYEGGRRYIGKVRKILLWTIVTSEVAFIYEFAKKLEVHIYGSTDSKTSKMIVDIANEFEKKSHKEVVISLPKKN